MQRISSKLQIYIQKDEAEQTFLFNELKTAEDVAYLLEVPYKQLLYILYVQDDSKKYKTFQIPKKTGGMRTISKPLGSIAILQEKLLPLIMKKYQAKNCVHGFVKGRGILTNASSHKISKRTKILNIDIENFYDSINFGRVRGLMMAKPFNMGKDAATLIAQILCWKGKLPQGACTSPVISNMILHRLDTKLTNLCHSVKSAYYTRYADDITISSNSPVFPATIAIRNSKTKEVSLGSDLINILKSEGFTINNSKVRLRTKKERQEITGLTVNEFPNVRKKFVRQLRAMIHAWKIYGLSKAADEYISKYDKNIFHNDISDTESYFKNVLYGKLAYLYMVRGKDNICTKYAKNVNSLDKTPPKFIKNIINMQYHIFLSHATEDKYIVEKIYRECSTNGINAFFDKNCIKTGDSIPQKINEALKTSKIFVVIASYIYTEKKWTCAELWSAVNKAIETGETRVFPIVIGSIDDFKKAFPLLGDKKAIIWKDNEKEIVLEIKKLLGGNSNENINYHISLSEKFKDLLKKLVIKLKNFFK